MSEESVKVFVRVRPLTQKELQKGINGNTQTKESVSSQIQPKNNWPWEMWIVSEIIIEYSPSTISSPQRLFSPTSSKSPAWASLRKFCRVTMEQSSPTDRQDRARPTPWWATCGARRRRDWSQDVSSPSSRQPSRTPPRTTSSCVLTSSSTTRNWETCWISTTRSNCNWENVLRKGSSSKISKNIQWLLPHKWWSTSRQVTATAPRPRHKWTRSLHGPTPSSQSTWSPCKRIRAKLKN